MIALCGASALDVHSVWIASLCLNYIPKCLVQLRQSPIAQVMLISFYEALLVLAGYAD